MVSEVIDWLHNLHKRFASTFQFTAEIYAKYREIPFYKKSTVHFFAHTCTNRQTTGPKKSYDK